MSALLQYTKDDASPEIFRLWSAIQGIGSAAMRRVWTKIGNGAIYPNLYVWLVSPPGIGKTMAITPVSDFLRKAQCCHIAPNDMSKQGLLDYLDKCPGDFMYEGDLFDFHYMALHIAELSNFMPKYDLSMIGILTDLFDCPAINDESKRHGMGKGIPFPGLSMLAGTATGNLGSTIPHDAWNSGFMARIILVHSNEGIIPEDMFAEQPGNKELGQEIVDTLKRIGKFKGKMVWNPEAQEAMRVFRKNPHETAPTHSRLIDYCTRRWFHLTKLSMVAALSEERMVVQSEDFQTALSWLLQAEATMPEIFKGMTQHEDGAIMEEIRDQLARDYLRRKMVPFEAHEILNILSKRVPANHINSFLDALVNANYIDREAGTSGATARYTPNLRRPTS